MGAALVVSDLNDELTLCQRETSIAGIRRFGNHGTANTKPARRRVAGGHPAIRTPRTANTKPARVVGGHPAFRKPRTTNTKPVRVVGGHPANNVLCALCIAHSLPRFMRVTIRHRFTAAAARGVYLRLGKSTRL